MCVFIVDTLTVEKIARGRNGDNSKSTISLLMYILILLVSKLNKILMRFIWKQTTNLRKLKKYLYCRTLFFVGAEYFTE